MPFSDAIRKRVRERSHFRCCLCHNLYAEAHHIEPEAKGGPNTEDNAAPLCPSCHETYGNDETKRLFIRQARDFWYKLCAERYKSPDTQQFAQMIDAKLNNVATKADVNAVLHQVVAIVEQHIASSKVTVEEARDAVAYVSLSAVSSMASLPSPSMASHMREGDVFNPTGVASSQAEAQAQSSASKPEQIETKKRII